MLNSLRLFAPLAALSVSLLAQSPTYHVGRAATAADIAQRDIVVGADGKGLPAGEGTAAEGAVVYANRCEECHGPEGKGADQVGFLGKPADLLGDSPKKTVGSYWPYAAPLWGYVDRAMPFDRPGELTKDQVYSVVAYILHLNGLIGENDKLNAETLPKIQMPNRDGFVPDPRPDAP